MTQSKKPRACDLAFALERDADNSRVINLTTLADKYKIDVAFAARLLRIQQKLGSNIATRWRAAKGKKVIPIIYMEWLAFRNYTEIEQHAAFDALQYMIDSEIEGNKLP